MSRLSFPAAPNLPLAPREWAPQYQDQFANVLRLYFNQLSNGTLQLAGRRGGKFLEFPCGAFQNNGNVVASAIDTPSLVPLVTVDYADGVFLVPGNGMHVEQSGLYNFQFSVQFRNTDTKLHNVYLWLRKNGADVAATTSAFSVPSSHAGGDGYLIGAANFYVDMTAGDYLEMWWATPDLTVSLTALPAQTTPYARPISPSVVGTLTFVSSRV